MALQVWLPLNGDLKNQGLSDVQVINNGATVNNNGKIGKCYSFNGSSNWIQISKPSKLTSIKNCSICFWVKSISSIVALGGISHDGNSSSLAGLTMMGNSWQVSGNSSNWKYVNGGTVANTSIWHHVCCTIDDNIITTYLDGSVVTTSSLSSLGIITTELTSSNFLEIGCDHPGGDEFFTGLINDFRVYDHCLSLKEVKEIAKGLVLHYPLNKPQANMAKGGNTYDLSLNSWVFSNQNGGTVRTLEYDEYGTPCVRLTRDDTAASGWSYFHYDRIENAKIKTNTTYTISFDIKASVSGTVGMSGFMRGNATNQLSNSNSNIQNTIIANKWNHIILQTTTKSDFSGLETTGQIIYMSLSGNFRNTGATMLLKNIKLEEGNKETSWIANESDSLYAAAGYASGIVYDCSGYQNNGIEVGTITGNSNTPRYRSSTVFIDSCAQYIKGPLQEWMKDNDFSMSCWFYKKTHERTSNGTTALGPQFIFSQGRDWYGSSDTNYYGVSIVSNQNGGIWIPIANTSFTSTINIPLNTWAHVVLTYDGTTAKLYINGILNTSKAVDRSNLKWGNADNAIIIGKMAYNNVSDTSYFPFVGNISDVRVYATALSAADVKALYNDAGYVDKNGNFHAYEFVEG